MPLTKICEPKLMMASTKAQEVAVFLKKHGFEKLKSHRQSVYFNGELYYECFGNVFMIWTKKQHETCGNIYEAEFDADVKLTIKKIKEIIERGK